MYPITTYLYTLPDCPGCEKARGYLKDNNIEFTTIPIDNPALELGVKMLFNGGIPAPFIFHPESGVSVFSGCYTKLLKVKIGD